MPTSKYRSGNRFAELRQSGPVGHRRGDADDARILFGNGDHRIAEDVLKLRPAGRPVLLAAVARLERVCANAVKRARIPLGRLVALSLYRPHVEQNGTLDIVRGLQRIHEHVVVMTVERPDIAEAELFEDHRRLLGGTDEVHRADFGALDRLLCGAAQRNALEHFFAGSTDEVRKRLAAEHRQIRGDRADVRRDRHLVVVEDHHELALERARVVERFVGQTARERAVAEHRDDRFVAADEIACRRHAQRRRDRGAGVTRPERIVRRLAAHRESGDASAFANRVEPAAAAGENFVDVRLVAHVPNEPVARAGRARDGARASVRRRRDWAPDARR